MVTLTCRLFREVETNSEKFDIDVDTGKSVYSLKKKIFKEVKKKNNVIFSEINVDNLMLWKVQISNDKEDKFSGLTLKNDENKDIKRLEEKISDYWDDHEKLPKAGCTHIIIDSPYLTALRKLKQLEIQVPPNKEPTNENPFIENENPAIEGIIDEDLNNEEIIRNSHFGQSSFVRLFIGMKTQTGEDIKIQLGDKLKHREKVVGKVIKTDKVLVVLCNETKCTSISGILQAHTGKKKPGEATRKRLLRELTLGGFSLEFLKNLE